MSAADEERERNLALLKDGTEAYNRGDLGFAVQHAADDVEVSVHHELINEGTNRGRDAFARWMANWQEAWSEMTIDIRDVETIDDTHLLVDVFQHGVGAASGVPVEMDLFQLIEVRDGQIARFHLYPDRETALAGLEQMRAAEGAA